MKKVSMFLLAIVFLAAILVAGCATTGRVEQTELKVAELKGFYQALNLDLGVARNDIRGLKEATGSLKTDLGATKNQLQEVTQKTEVGLNAIKSDLGATKTQVQGQVQGLTRKAEDLEKGLEIVRAEIKTEIKQVEREYKDLRVYALNLRKIIAEREAKHSYKADEVEKISVYLVGPFTTGQATLNEFIESGLIKALSEMKNKQEEILEIHGFASVIGFRGKSPEESEKLNQELSFGRAKVIQAWFKGKDVNIPDEKVLSFGGVIKFGAERDNRCVAIFGKPKPVAPPTPATPTPTTPSPPTK